MRRLVSTLIVTALLSGPAIAAPAEARSAMAAPELPPALEAVVERSHEALRGILNGDPSGYAALFADRHDISLGNPFGPFGKGREQVLAALGNAARKYTDGSVVGVDRVAVYGGGGLYVLVEIERDRARLGNSTQHSEFAARVTSVYELTAGEWRLVHRHADPITSYRPAESVLPGPVRGAARLPPCGRSSQASWVAETSRCAAQ